MKVFHLWKTCDKVINSFYKIGDSFHEGLIA